MDVNASLDVSHTVMNSQMLKKWMFCLNAVDITLNSEHSCLIPEPLYVLLEDARDEMQQLFHFYEGIFYQPKDGRA